MNIIIFGRKFYKNQFCISMAFIIIIFIIIFVIRSIDQPSNFIDKYILVVIPDTLISASISSDQILDHNREIISLLREREATADVTGTSRESDMKQTRTIYIAVLVVFLTLMFSKKNKNNTLFILMIFFLFIGVMYWVECHTEDLRQRGRDCTYILYRSTENIINSDLLESVWYNLDYSKYLSQQKYTEHNSFFRKVWKMCNPNGEQIVIFVIPIVIILFMFFYNWSIYSSSFKITSHYRKRLMNKF